MIENKEHEHVFKICQCPPRVYSGRVAGCDRDHRHFSSAAAASHSGGAGIGSSFSVSKQRQAIVSCVAKLSWYKQGISPQRALRCPAREPSGVGHQAPAELGNECLTIL